MIIGTAGHIDHGKTSLVRALTGVDTDRLKEEKARGISIELGYAYTPLPDTEGKPNEVLGIIDVPGHEKFIHTMAAGAVGIDHALLVVAVDDGVMPQTVEHLAIVNLLGVGECTVALTKVDRVASERVDAVRNEVRSLLAGTPFADAPVFTTNALVTDDPGVAALKAHLFRQAQGHASRRSDGLFRLAVDRIFTLPGQGTVVTGTVFGGEARVGDTLKHSASSNLVRVRSIHAQNRPSDAGRAGQRVALNLSGIEREAISRGDWIVAPLALQHTRRIDVRLRMLPDGGGQQPMLGQWSTVHVHLGTAHHLAHVVLLSDDPLLPGSEARAQLVFNADVFAVAGDHLIVRNAQANRTVAGGFVLDPYAPERKRRSAERKAYLDALESVLAGGDLAPLIAEMPYGAGQHQLARLLGKRPDTLQGSGALITVGKADGDALLIATARWNELQARVQDTLMRFHERTPDEPGVNAARLRRMALPGLTQPVYDTLWQGLLNALLVAGRIAQQGAWLHLPGHSVQLSATEAAMADRLLPAVEAGMFDPPWVRDLAQTHQLPEEIVRQLLRKLARQGKLFQVVKDLFYSVRAVDDLLAVVVAQAEQSAGGMVEVRHFRDATQLGRKRAVQILEFFDRMGYTRRIGDAHLLRLDLAEIAPGPPVESQ